MTKDIYSIDAVRQFIGAEVNPELKSALEAILNNSLQDFVQETSPEIRTAIYDKEKEELMLDNGRLRLKLVKIGTFLVYGISMAIDMQRYFVDGMGGVTEIPSEYH